MYNKLPVIFFVVFSLVGCSSKDTSKEVQKKSTDKPILNTKSIKVAPPRPILKIYSHYNPNQNIEKPIEKDKNTSESKHIPEAEKKDGKSSKDNKSNISKESSKSSATSKASTNKPSMSQSTGDIPTRKKKFQEGVFGGSWNHMKRTFSDSVEKLRKTVKK
jgi:hypothetical protein